MKKALLAVVLVVAAAAALTVYLMKGRASGPAEPEKRTTVRVVHVPTASVTPLYVAMERGYFSKAGLDVELSKFGSTSMLMPAFLAGKAEVATATPVDVLAAAAKFPGAFKIISAGIVTAEHDNDAFMVKKGAPYNSIADLKGKKIGTFPGAAMKLYVQLVAEKEFGDRKALTPVPMPPSALLGALGAGKVDAAYMLEPMAQLGAKRGVCEYLIQRIGARYVTDPNVGVTTLISQRFIDEHPEAARAFVRAYAQGVRDRQKDPKAAAAYVPKYTKIPVPVVYKGVNTLPEEFPGEALRAMAEVFLREKIIDSKPDVDKLRYQE